MVARQGERRDAPDSEQGVLARSIEARLRVSPATAKFWAEDLLDSETRGVRCDLHAAHAAVRTVAAELDPRRPVTYADLLGAWRDPIAREHDRRAQDRRFEAIDSDRKALGPGSTYADRREEAQATIARVAAAVALSGGTRGRTTLEVAREIQALQRDPGRLAELEAGAESDRRARLRDRARALATEPLSPRLAEFVRRGPTPTVD